MPVLTLEQRHAGLPFAAVVAASVVVIGSLVAWLHLDHLPITVCVFKTMTGIPCMTCGTTRAFGSLARFDVGAAFHINPLATAVLLTALVLGLAQLALLPSGKRLRIRTPPVVTRTFWIALGLAVLVNWIYLIRTGV